MYLFDVHLLENGKLRKPVLASKLIVIAELAQTDKGWKFTNFIYPESKENILNLMKN